MLDVSGLVICVTVGGALAALGAGIDSLLLERHAKWFNLKAIQWWDYFDGLKLADVPRGGIQLFIKLKVRLLGDVINFNFVLRTCIASFALAAVAIYGGTALGLWFVGLCQGTQIGEPISAAVWRMTGGFSNLVYLGPINLVFDVITILVTAAILTYAVKKSDYVLGTMMLVDILACLILFEALMWLTDDFRNLRFSFNGFGTASLHVYTTLMNANCATVFMLAPALIYSATVVVPTMIYLLLIFTLFVLREAFKLMKWVAMHVLEKSSEDTKKTSFGHVGLALGMLVAIGKATIELIKLMSGAQT